MSDYGHDDVMDALDLYLPADERDAVAAYIERFEAECDTLRDAMSWYCSTCNTMYPYESVKDASGVLPKCPKCGDYVTTETARRNAYTAALERDYGKTIAKCDEWKRAAEQAADALEAIRDMTADRAIISFAKRVSIRSIASHSCAAIEAVRKEATDE